jgi:hypothetical protein
MMSSRFLKVCSNISAPILVLCQGVSGWLELAKTPDQFGLAFLLYLEVRADSGDFAVMADVLRKRLERLARGEMGVALAA